jgi:hypothetical protein
VAATSTQELCDEYARAKDRCAALIEQLRTSTLPDAHTSEEKLKAQLVAELLRMKALKNRLGRRSASEPTTDC